jgi:signal transduction histidine kinase
MSSGPESVRLPLLARVFGLRLALWYSVLFAIGVVTVGVVTYSLTALSIGQRDQQILQGKLGEYAAAYRRGGLEVLAATVRTEQQVAPERLFVRVVDRGFDALVLSSPEGWDQAKLETVTTQLGDGTIVQVGKSTESRDDLLARFRLALTMLTLLIVAIALTGGWLITQSALYPIRRLAAAVRRIIRTGRTDERVEIEGSGDAVDDLTQLFNAMLDRIEGLVIAMRGALDNVSHDLRTPLARLRGSAEMALAAPPDAQRDREALADCVEEVDRVRVMLDTLMDISEAESGALQLRREPTPLAGVVARAVDLYRDVADAKGVTLTAPDPAPGDDADRALVVDGDRPRLEQVAANLIDNAVKYTPAGGRIDVSLSREHDRAVVRVTDTGPGIPPEEIPRIWERLFRGDASRAERGLGLGLSLVKAIVEAHGGAVDVTSKVGEGSTFTVSLPLGEGHLSRL